MHRVCERFVCKRTYVYVLVCGREWGKGEGIEVDRGGGRRLESMPVCMHGAQ